MRGVVAGDERRVADDLGLVGGGRPGDEHLWVRAQQGVDAVGLGAGRHDYVVRGRLGFGESAAGAHQHDRGDDREAEDAESQRDGDDLGTLELGSGSEHGIER